MRVPLDVLQAGALRSANLILGLLLDRHLATFSSLKAIKYWMVSIPMDTVNFIFLGKHKFLHFNTLLAASLILVLRNLGQKVDRILEGSNPMVRAAQDNPRHELRALDGKNITGLTVQPARQGNPPAWTTICFCREPAEDPPWVLQQKQDPR